MSGYRDLYGASKCRRAVKGRLCCTDLLVFRRSKLCDSQGDIGAARTTMNSGYCVGAISAVQVPSVLSNGLLHTICRALHIRSHVCSRHHVPTHLASCLKCYCKLLPINNGEYEPIRGENYQKVLTNESGACKKPQVQPMRREQLQAAATQEHCRLTHGSDSSDLTPRTSITDTCSVQVGSSFN